MMKQAMELGILDEEEPQPSEKKNEENCQDRAKDGTPETSGPGEVDGLLRSGLERKPITLFLRTQFRCNDGAIWTKLKVFG